MFAAIPFLAGAASLYLIEDITEESHKKPHFNVLATRDRSGLTNETNAVIDLVTVNPETFPVGSFKYRAHRYPGDIDIFEKVKVCCTETVAKKKIATDIQKIAKKIANARKYGVFLGDFKAGIDDRFKIDIGEIGTQVQNDSKTSTASAAAVPWMEAAAVPPFRSRISKNIPIKSKKTIQQNSDKVIGYNGRAVRKQLKKLYDAGLLTKEEYTDLLVLAPVNEITPSQWEYLNTTLRKYYVVRWNLEELLSGVKVLRGGKILRLEDAITHNSIVKIDIWAPINGKYNEITNFFLIVLQHPDGTETVLNAQLGDRIKQLDKDIRKYSSPEHRNSLKLAKRLWNKALTVNDQSMYDTLYPLFNSDATMLSQITSEIEVIINILSGLPHHEVPIKTLIRQIDGFKERIGNTLEIQIDTKPLNNIINQIIKYYDRNQDTWDPNVIIEYLEDLQKRLKKPIEDYSKAFLVSNGIDL